MQNNVILYVRSLQCNSCHLIRSPSIFCIISGTTKISIYDTTYVFLCLQKNMAVHFLFPKLDMHVMQHKEIPYIRFLYFNNCHTHCMYIIVHNTFGVNKCTPTNTSAAISTIFILTREDVFMVMIPQMLGCHGHEIQVLAYQ